MTFQYDFNTDMLYISIRSGISFESEEVSPGVVFDYDNNNRLVGIEIEDASNIADLSKFEINFLPITKIEKNENNLNWKKTTKTNSAISKTISDIDNQYYQAEPIKAFA